MNQIEYLESQIESYKHRIEVAKQRLESAKANLASHRAIGNHKKCDKPYRVGNKSMDGYEYEVYIAKENWQREKDILADLRADLQKEKAKERERKASERADKQEEKQLERDRRELEKLRSRSDSYSSSSSSRSSSYSSYSSSSDDDSDSDYDSDYKSSSSSSSSSYSSGSSYSSSRDYSSYVSKPEKSRIIAGLLAFFLGVFGIHYFYCKKPIAGLVFLGVSMIGGLGLHSDVIPGIVVLVSMIQGVSMIVRSQDSFEKTFVSTDNKFPLI